MTTAETTQESNALKNWDSAVNLMDDDIREAVHAELAPCSNLQFLRRYAELHKEKFGESSFVLLPEVLGNVY